MQKTAFDYYVIATRDPNAPNAPITHVLGRTMGETVMTPDVYTAFVFGSVNEANEYAKAVNAEFPGTIPDEFWVDHLAMAIHSYAHVKTSAAIDRLSAALRPRANY